MPADTMIHPFPELRQLAESEARAMMVARALPEWERRTRSEPRPMPEWWAVANKTEHESTVRGLTTLLCDLSRDASRDAVARVVGERIAWPAWEVAKAEDNWTTLVALCRKVGIPEPARWEPHPPFAATLTAIVRHLWPENANAR